MAEDKDLDEIILIDDDEDSEEEEFFENDNIKLSDKKTDSSSKYLVIIVILLILIISVAGLYIVLKPTTDEELSPEINSTKILQNIKKHSIITQPKTKIDKLTIKANKLYNSGKKDEALKIYKQISSFHKYLSFFNLGASSFKEKNYEKAINYFQKSSKSDDLKFESTFNIAICYKQLNDNENFKKYLNSADDFIMCKYNSSLFDYYYALIYQYKNKPIESLLLLRKYKKHYFDYDKNLLLAKDYAIIGKYSLAIDHLTKLKDSDYYYLIGILYAKTAKYDLAENSFLNSIKAKKNIKKSLMALSLAQNKLGMFLDCSSTLKKLYLKYPNISKDFFSTKVIIKRSLYNPILAQQEFKKSIFLEEYNRFSFVFYFAPYKLFNPKQSNSIIKKGVKEIYIDNIQSADSYLKQASQISDININIIHGLKLIQQHKIYAANKLFKTLINKYPNHSILHYNLALTYANISDFQNAKKHFEKSFLLDKQNYLSAFLGAYSAVLINKNYDDETLTKLVKNSNNKNKDTIQKLYKILKNDSSININEKKNYTSFELALNIIMSNLSRNNINYKIFTKKLHSMMPNDLITNIIYVDEISQNKGIKEYARNIQQYLMRKSMDISPLIYGETFPRELYIRILNIAGVTRFAKNILENELQTNQNQIALLQSLAYTYLYTKEYEKAYKIYNNLIDNLKVNDPHTLFLASVSAIGANHHANAIALLELANLEDMALYNSRYALGLLYQEAKNLEGASIQFSKIGNNGFKSKYFEFNLNH